MKQHNVLGSSKGYIDRIVKSYEAVKMEMEQKYFLSTIKFARLNLEGESGFTINAKMKELRKVKTCHRGATEFTIDHSKKNYNRNRLA